MPDTKQPMPHQTIEFIDVFVSGTLLTVKAIKESCVRFETSYELNRDFQIDAGKIVMNQTLALLSRGAGDVLAGPSYDSYTLGLDQNRQGKVRFSSHAAGLVLCLLPVAVSESRDIRFERVSNTAGQRSWCGSRPLN